MGPNEELSLRSDEALFLSLAFKDLQSEKPSPRKLLGLLGRIFAAKTVAVFAPQFCLFAWGSQATAAEQCAITGVEESSVVTCRQSGRPAYRSADRKSPLFGACAGASFPLPERSDQVLYFGQAKRLETKTAAIFSQHLTQYLNLHDKLLFQKNALSQRGALLERLSASQEGTRRALSALTRMETSLELPELLDGFTEEVRESLSFAAGFLILDGDLHELVSDVTPNERHRLAMARWTRASRVSVLVEDLEKTPYAELAAFGRCGLISPLLDGGALLLFRNQKFDPQHRSTAELCVGYLALSLRFSSMHSHVQRSQAEMARAGRLASVGQMAAGLAHEINNPLGSIVLALDTVKRFVESKPQVALSVLEEAFSAAERAREIVQKMLHFSRDSRQGHRQFEVQQWLADLTMVVAPRLSQDGIELVVDAPDEGFLYGNPGDLMQVGVNLIFNAQDAVRQVAAAKVIKLSLKRTKQDWVFTVSDDGPGVLLENKDRIFDPFFTTKEVGEGTGLGLHVSRQIVEAHQGSLRLLETEHGAAFQMSLRNTDDHDS